MGWGHERERDWRGCGGRRWAGNWDWDWDWDQWDNDLGRRADAIYIQVYQTEEIRGAGAIKDTLIGF